MTVSASPRSRASEAIDDRRRRPAALLDRRRSRRPPVVLWHGFLSTSYAWHDVAPALAEAASSARPRHAWLRRQREACGQRGLRCPSLAEECRALVAAIGFGAASPVVHAAHDMGALPALIWTADHAEEVAGLLYIEAPVMLRPGAATVFAYSPEAMAQGSMWWWILPLAPGVPERLIVGMSAPSSPGSTRVTMSSTTPRSRRRLSTSICVPLPGRRRARQHRRLSRGVSRASTRPSR